MKSLTIPLYYSTINLNKEQKGIKNMNLYEKLMSEKKEKYNSVVDVLSEFFSKVAYALEGKGYSFSEYLNVSIISKEISKAEIGDKISAEDLNNLGIYNE